MMNGMGFICIAVINERVDIHIERTQEMQKGGVLWRERDGGKWHKH